MGMQGALQALRTGASGMESFLFQLDTVANNLANASTTAYKRSRTNFEDLYYQYLKLPGALDTLGQPTATGIFQGLGTRVRSTDTVFQEGSLEETGNQLDVAIVGRGFFQVQGVNQILYTRMGNFALNANGQLVLNSADRGWLVIPGITIPQDSTQITISEQGIVSVLQPGSTTLQQVGNLQLARFINPKGLIQRGQGLYQATFASGNPLLGQPGGGSLGIGSLRQGYLEQSNVEPVRELVDLIKTQRSFELNSQVVQASDQMLQLIANLRRI